MADQLEAARVMVRACEGTDSPNGYRMMFGGRLFNSFADHPRVRFPYTDKAGHTYTTSAAGAYQAEIATWDRIERKLNLRQRALDLGVELFSPPMQDIFATELFAECGAVADFKEGRLQAAIDKIGTQWASLPSAKVAQPHRTYVFCTTAFLNAGGFVV
jgi:muramidase (phage lysozyme)